MIATKQVLLCCQAWGRNPCSTLAAAPYIGQTHCLTMIATQKVLLFGEGIISPHLHFLTAGQGHAVPM